MTASPKTKFVKAMVGWYLSVYEQVVKKRGKLCAA